MVSFGIGQAVRRVEDQRFLTGRGSYVDDIELPRQCHAAAVLSTHAHARIKRIDVAAARAAPGVALVLTGVDALAEDIGGIPPLQTQERTSQRHRRVSQTCHRRLLAGPHSITSSAMASSVKGTSRSSAFAAFRLMTSSNVVGR